MAIMPTLVSSCQHRESTYHEHDHHIFNTLHSSSIENTMGCVQWNVVSYHKVLRPHVQYYAERSTSNFWSGTKSQYLRTPEVRVQSIVPWLTTNLSITLHSVSLPKRTNHLLKFLENHHGIMKSSSLYSMETDYSAQLVHADRHFILIPLHSTWSIALCV